MIHLSLVAENSREPGCDSDPQYHIWSGTFKYDIDDQYHQLSKWTQAK